jgi:hypothetical protein
MRGSSCVRDRWQKDLHWSLDSAPFAGTVPDLLDVDSHGAGQAIGWNLRVMVRRQAG